jgi:hypothetical protein
MKINVANPSDKSFHDHSFLIALGAYGWTRILVYADHLEDAIDEVAEWCVKHAPGHIMQEGDEYLTELRKEACEDAGLVWPPPSPGDSDLMQPYYSAFEGAEADLMYTESGYLTSHEVHLVAENPSKKDLIEMYNRT